MNIDEVYKLCNFIAGKNQQGAVTPDNFNLLVKQSNSEYQSYLLGEVEQFQYNNPKARIELGQNLVLLRLSPFIQSPVPLTIDSNGKSPYPNDYVERVALYTVSMSKIRWATQDRVAAFLSDPIDVIATNPIYLVEDSGFQFYPLTLAQAKLSYIRTGATPFWGYNQSGSILTLTGLSGGASYVNGTYLNVPLMGGYGIQALATIVVVGGIVTTVTITNTGANFLVGDILTTPNSFLGGTGTGFTITVATITNFTRAVYNPATSQDLLWSDGEQIEVVARILKKIGVNLQAGAITQYATEIKQTGG